MLNEKKNNNFCNNCTNKIIVKKKRQKRITVKCTPWHLFKDFAINTTLHGLKYVGVKSCFVERLFWAITFLLSVGICITQIYQVWEKWNNSPVIVTFSGLNMPVFKVPFPAVTICPQNKIIYSYYNYTEAKELYENNNYIMKKKDKEFFEDISLVCAEPKPSDNTKYLNLKSAQTVRNIQYAAPGVTDLFDHDCTWRGNKVDCSDLFQAVLTNEGICYTFNSLPQNEIFREKNIQRQYKYTESSTVSNRWSHSEGYDTTSISKLDDAYPRMGRENGASPDLEIILHEDFFDVDPSCVSLHRGFKVYLHNPADMPSASLYYYAMIENQETSLAVKFNMVTTANSLKGYSPKVRQCYFPEDKTLKYFQLYTQVNCELECQANYTFRYCKCVWYNMPHEDSNHICSINEHGCVLQALDHLVRDEMKASLEVDSLKYNREACRCLPACNSTTYDAEVLKTQLNLDHYLAHIDPYFYQGTTEYPKLNYSRLVVYFKEARFPAMQRLELFGVTDFLAQCGGLLGVFLGFSFISLVEIIYFPTIRAVLWWRNYPLTTDEEVDEAEEEETTDFNKSVLLHM